MIEINWHPETRVLRQFGAIAAVALPLCAWWYAGDWRIIAGAAVVALTATVLAWLRPTMLRHIFIACSIVTAPIGMVASELLIVLMYFGVFLPLGLVFRLLGRNPLDWRFQPAAKTYWQPKQQPRAASRYLRQY